MDCYSTRDTSSFLMTTTSSETSLPFATMNPLQVTSESTRPASSSLALTIGHAYASLSRVSLVVATPVNVTNLPATSRTVSCNHYPSQKCLGRQYPWTLLYSSQCRTVTLLSLSLSTASPRWHTSSQPQTMSTPTTPLPCSCP